MTRPSTSMDPSANALSFHGPALCSIREEAGVTRKALASRLGLPWQVISLWEDEHAASCPDANQLMALCRELSAQPTEFLVSLQDEPATDERHEQAAGRALQVVLDGPALELERVRQGWSRPQAATLARVTDEQLFQAEDGHWIDLGALLRIVWLYHDDARTALMMYVVSRPGEQGAPDG